MTQRTDRTGGLLAAGALLAEWPEDLPKPSSVTVYGHRLDRANVLWYLSRDDCGERGKAVVAAEILRHLGGRWEKTAGSNDNPVLYFRNERPGLGLTVAVSREEVCERRVVSTKTVTEEIPAREAQTVTRTVEEVEWDCSPLLSKAARIGAESAGKELAEVTA